MKIVLKIIEKIKHMYDFACWQVNWYIAPYFYLHQQTAKMSVPDSKISKNKIGTDFDIVICLR